MFNTLEYYGFKNDNNSYINASNNNNKELKKNGKDYTPIQRRNDIIQQKIHYQKMLNSSNNPKYHLNKKETNRTSSIINDDNTNSNKKNIKVVEINLNDNVDKKSRSNTNIAGIKIDDNKKEGNIDMVEQALKNLSQFKDNNDDDSF